jgi:hypothetical protein
MPGKLLRRVLLFGILIGLVVGTFYIVRFLVIAWMWASILYGRDFMDASAKNAVFGRKWDQRLIWPTFQDHPKFALDASGNWAAPRLRVV